MFMHYELTVNLCSEERRVFLQDGFYAPSDTTASLHNHNYAEIHVISGGNAVIAAGERSYHLESGDAMIIPKGIYHRFTQKDSTTMRTAFQIDYDAEAPVVQHIGSRIASEFLSEISACHFENEIKSVPLSIPLYIFTCCHRLCCNKRAPVSHVTDYGFLIHEFFSRNYNRNIHLCDLAEFLHLSERQTERLVTQHTGNTFRKELMKIRIDTAKQLINAGVPLSETAEYVGYNSYTGFWKAMKSRCE